ncbi:nucleoside hydrolase [Pseudarthrobacter sp. SSS035]|uniref:nucleoside hydrolase n=1 Tax=Pseudarthrobacter sp. SSS035 TaxID=2931399 RepID=UPI00200C9EDA|nr:nucleoside hydrolase [Pseudarthrobacter sp. SSS035]
MGALHHIILDTDIGSDVDDALALALILGSPEARLLGITTVYGDTAPSGYAWPGRFGKLAGQEIPVHHGLEQPMSGREVWWPGHEGSLHDGLENEPVEEEDAIRYLTSGRSQKRPGEIDVIAIGPLTNIAAALESDPALRAQRAAPLDHGGGGFGMDEAEHNFRSDDQAA